MSDFFTSIAGMIVLLGVLIFIHEWGHFLATKLFGVRVEIFSLGFGPRLWGRRRGPTDYRISALPLGGYVKMAGDNPTEARTGAPDEFLSKPRWQRVIIALAGPAMNLVLAVLLMAGLLMTGVRVPVYSDNPAEVAGVLAGSPAEQAGIRAGARIVEFAGRKHPTWEEIRLELLLLSSENTVPVSFVFDGETHTAQLSVPPIARPCDEFALTGYPAEPVLVAGVASDLPAGRAGLQAGDVILLVNGEAVLSPCQFAQTIEQSQGKPLHLLIRRGERDLTLSLRPQLLDRGDGRGPRYQIGISFGTASIERRYGPGQAAQRAFWWNVRLTQQILVVVGQLLQGQMSLKQLEGPLRIAQHSGEAARQGATPFLQLMAIISLNLGILNLLPIPILDGGHILLLAIEGLLRRDLSVKVKERFVQAGLVFLLVIFVIVMYNDVLKIFNR